jgi:hypothetical protein
MRYLILIKEAMYQKKKTIINLCAPNISTSNFNFIKHTLKDLKAQIETKIVVVGDFKTPLSQIDRSTKQKNQQRNQRT